MIFKVYYQKNSIEVPVRERTNVLYMEAVSEREVRSKLAKTPYNIEFIQELDSAHLEYEKQNENFKMTEIDA